MVIRGLLEALGRKNFKNSGISEAVGGRIDHPGRQNGNPRQSALRIGTHRYRGDEHRFQVQVCLDELSPDAVKVKLYAEAIDGDEPILHAMTRVGQLVSESGWRYGTTIPADRPASDFTPRIIPYHFEAFVPLDASKILWAK